MCCLYRLLLSVGMSLKDFDFDTALKSLIELVTNNLQKDREETEHHFDWLASFPSKAKQRLGCATEEFKMPKTPARKKTRKQKKRILHADEVPEESDIPSKRGKTSHESDDLQDSVDGRDSVSTRESVSARPSRHASTAARSKIQNSLKMMNLSQKMRRPSGESELNTSSFQEAHDKRTSTVKVVEKISNRVEVETKKTVITLSSTPEKIPINDVGKVAAEAPEVNVTIDLPADIDKPQPASETVAKPAVTVAKPAVTDTKPAVTDTKPIETAAKPVETAKRGRTTRKGKKAEEAAAEEVAAEPEAEPKKRGARRVRKPTEEKPSAASPRITRHQKVAKVDVKTPNKVTPTTPKMAASTTPKKAVDAKSVKFQSPGASSPMRKVFTPKLVFSPFKASSVKTKVEAFEAVLSSKGTTSMTIFCDGDGDDGDSESTIAVLPEARVLLQRLTDRQLKEAGVVTPRSAAAAAAAATASPALSAAVSIKEPAAAEEKRGTFVLKEFKEIKEFKENTPPNKKESVSRTLARKSLDRAKHLALSAARTKFLNGAAQNESAQSPSIHVNQNAANIMSKYRFTNTSGSSGSSGSLMRHVAMTGSRANGGGGGDGSSKMAPLVTKAAEDEEMKKKMQELKRLKEKEEEAARKREELIKARAEMQKIKIEARAKRAMEQRLLRAKQLDLEQKQKLEDKEEKSNNLKMKLTAENQEKAGRVRAALLQRQQEAEQRRKAEEMAKLREYEEEQQRLIAIKKEQEEQEKIAKLKQAEIEKAKAAAPAPKLNTTVTLPSNVVSNSYQITPTRVTKAGKLVPNPDNYDIADMRSDDSTDDDSRPKKTIPTWARSAHLKGALKEQATAAIETDLIFPPEILLLDPNLNTIFKIKRARFDKRTSSAVWKTPPSKLVF